MCRDVHQTLRASYLHQADKARCTRPTCVQAKAEHGKRRQIAKRGMRAYVNEIAMNELVDVKARKDADINYAAVSCLIFELLHLTYLVRAMVRGGGGLAGM